MRTHLRLVIRGLGYYPMGFVRSSELSLVADGLFWLQGFIFCILFPRTSNVNYYRLVYKWPSPGVGHLNTERL